MNITDLSDNGLLMIHEAIKNALHVDDAITQGNKPYGAREYPDFLELSQEVETVLTKRGIEFDPVNW